MHIPPSGTTQYVKHTWVAHIENQCVGHIHFLLETNNRIHFLDAWVHEDHRRKGIFRLLWDTRWDYIMNIIVDIKHMLGVDHHPYHYY